MIGHFFSDLAAVVWAARWLLTLLLFAGLGALYVDALDTVRRQRVRISALERTTEILRGHVRSRRAAPSVVAGRVRQ